MTDVSETRLVRTDDAMDSVLLRARTEWSAAMSSLRTDDDTWDIATSVGTTAVMVAAARAARDRHGTTR